MNLFDSVGILLTPTYLLLGITVLTSVWAFSEPDLMARWVLRPHLVWHRRQWWRVLTSGFVHADYGHLGFNLFTFFFFGTEIERVCRGYFGRGLGTAAFLLIYLGGIIIANLPTVYQERNNSQYVSLGASGGVAAVLYAGIILNPLRKLYLFFLPIGIPGFLFGALYAGFSLVQARRQVADGINHSAHLAGALYGVVIMLALIPQAAPLFLEQLMGWFGR